MTTIRYFIPEDGDSEDHPNIFLMSKPTQSGFSPRLKDVKDSFPMPGRYHFRFKTPLIPGTDREKNAVSVWMDCVNDNQHVGVWRNTIFAKVTRISMEDDEDDYDFRVAAGVNGNGTTNGQTMSRAHSNASSVASNPSTAAPGAVNANGMQQSSQPSSVPAPAPAPTENLLGVFDEPPPTSSTHSSDANFLDVSSSTGVGGSAHHHVGGGGGAEASLLDMTGPTYYNSGSSANNSNHDDFLGMTSQPVQVQSMGNASAANTAPAAAPAMNRSGHASMPVSGSMPYNGYGGGVGGTSSGVRPAAGGRNNAFDTFSNDNGPFGGLQWK